MIEDAGEAGTKVTVYGNTDDPTHKVDRGVRRPAEQDGLRRGAARSSTAASTSRPSAAPRRRPRRASPNWFQDFPHPKNFMFLVDGASIQPTNNQNFGNVDDPEITEGDRRAEPGARADRRGGRRSGRTPTGSWSRGRTSCPTATASWRRSSVRADGLRELHEVPSGLEQRLLELLPQVAHDACPSREGGSAPSRWGNLSLEGERTFAMATEPVTEQTGLQAPAAWEDEAEREHVHGMGPWRLGLRRLRRNKVALAFGVLFVLLVAACLAAPAVGRARRQDGA